jgi:hypothetical protein
MNKCRIAVMGKKSASKMQTRPPSAPPPREPDGASTPWLIVAIVALIAVGAVFAYVRSSRVEPDAAQAAQPAAANAAADQVNAEPPSAKFGPHKQANLPPLPFSPVPMSRPPEVVNAAYRFAAEHPEVLSYVPCYCGCEHSGHRGNDDCFVTARAPNGDVTEWEPHGMT